MMRRRDFLLSTAGAAAGLALGPGFDARASTERDPVAAAFAKRLAEDPRLLGYATAAAEHFDAQAELVSGQTPRDLLGTLYRNGPARHEVGGRRYHHWFDGDGLVQAFRFTGDGLRHRARFVETAKLANEREAGRPLVQGFGTSWPDLPPLADPTRGNPANISVLWHADRLFALWEAADAYALDPESLATQGVHTWSSETAGVPFSAHPRVEPDGTLWNFGSAPWAGLLVVYRIGADGRLAAAVPIQLETPSYVHDFVVTENHVVFVLPPLHYESGGNAETFLEQHRWDGEAPTRWLVVDKADLGKRRWYEAPPCFVFHFANAWEESGTLHLDACVYPDASIMYGQQKRVMWGEWERAIFPSATTWSLDLASGHVRSEARGLVSEFPSIDARRVGRRHRHVVALSRVGGDTGGPPLLDAVTRQDVETGAVQSFRFPDHVIPEEHLLVPRSSAVEAEGWVIGTALDTVERATQLSVFDAQHLEDGPVATWRLPYALPLGLHGCFVS